MTNNYINFIAVEELFNQERTSIQDDNSLDYPTKRMLVNELDRVWQYILQIPIREHSSTDVQPIDVKEILKHLDSLMICVGNTYNTSHYLLESDMEFIEKQEKFIRELLSNKI